MERTNDKITEKEWYKRKIVEMVEGENDICILYHIYLFVKNMVKRE